MMQQKKIIRLLSKNQLSKSVFGGIATIFMLHRVGKIDKQRLPANENMKLSPDFLKHTIEMLLGQGYEMVSLDRLYEILMQNEPVKNQVVFTLDDGYKDNLTEALPIFEQYNVPFTVYITTSFPNQTAKLWWYVLEDILLEKQSLVIDGVFFNLATLQEKQSVFMRLRSKVLAMPQNKIPQYIQQLTEKIIDWKRYCDELCLSWQEIITLANHPLVTIGSHTVNHFALNQLSKEVVLDEIITANKEIESRTEINIEHFAYPFGSFNEIGAREFELTKQLNFKTVTTTRRGNIFLQHKNHLESLPRIMLTEDFQLEDMYKLSKQRIVTL